MTTHPRPMHPTAPAHGEHDADPLLYPIHPNPLALATLDADGQPAEPYCDGITPLTTEEN